METIIKAVNSLWKMNIFTDILDVLKYIVVILPLVIFILYEPAREYIRYHFYDTIFKVLVFFYLFIPVSFNTTQIYLNYKINRGLIEINKELNEPKLWLMRAIEKDTFKKLEKLERR